MNKIVGATGAAHPVLFPSLIQVYCTSDLMDGNQFLALASPEKSRAEGICFATDDNETLCLEKQDDNALEDFNSLAEKSFHSLHYIL